jgi:hypothetical protein
MFVLLFEAHAVEEALHVSKVFPAAVFEECSLIDSVTSVIVSQPLKSCCEAHTYGTRCAPFYAYRLYRLWCFELIATITKIVIY